MSLAAIATVVIVRRQRRSSPLSEATHVLNSIRSAQEAFHAETLEYADVSPDLDATYPAARPSLSFKTAWGAPCGARCNPLPKPNWAAIGVHVDGPLTFGYATIAGKAGSPPRPATIRADGHVVTFPNPSPTDWFVIDARVDGANGDVCRVYATSWSSELYFDCDEDALG